MSQTGDQHDDRDDRQYQTDGDCMVMQNDNGPVRLSNFTAKIIAKIVRDDGAEAYMHYEIEVQRQEKKRRVVVPAAQFRRLRWADELGPEFIVYVEGRRHLPVAIQEISSD